jgi:uncharacterized membrane protein
MQINGSQVAVATQRLLISKMVCGIVTLVLWQVHTGSWKPEGFHLNNHQYSPWMMVKLSIIPKKG